MEDNTREMAIQESLLEKARTYQIMYEVASRKIEELINKENKKKFKGIDDDCNQSTGYED